MVNEYRTLQEIVFDTIKNKIIKGEFKPGQRLVASDLAKEMDVSRMPIRESLAKLESIGLVELIPHKGAIVNELSAKDYVEIFHIRSALEGLAARLACPNLTEEDIEIMRAANDKVRKMMDKDDVEFQRVNRVFHSTIWKRTKSSRLQELLSNLYSEAAQYRHMVVIRPGRMKKVFEEHEAFLDALIKRDAYMAEKMVKEHYESTLTWLIKILNK